MVSDDDHTPTPPTSRELDWSLFEDRTRLLFLSALDEDALASSDSLGRVTRVAAVASASPFAQISLIGADQFVPVSHGLTYAPSDQHTPIRDSLCSVTMASGGVLRIDDTRAHEWTRSLPPVTDGGVGAYLGVPLYDPESRPIGALCVFDRTPRAWASSDEELLLDLAELVTRELHLVAALEHATVSEIRLRKVIDELVDRPRLGDGTVLRARAAYSFPADAPAGGDWVDWIELPDRIAFSIGDVTGHGLGSIVVMEEMRHALRAYALESVGPATAIAKTSQLLRQLRPGEIATAIKADFDPVSGRVRFAVAGHPPPIHVHLGRAALVPVRPGPPLGVLTDPPDVCELLLEHGDRLIVYTDGVVERRRESIDVGLARLLAAAERHADSVNLEVTARAIVDELATEGRDDACLLLIERPAAGGHPARS